MSATLQIHSLITPHENAGKLQLLSPFADEETEAQSGSTIAQGLNNLEEEADLELWSQNTFALAFGLSAVQQATSPLAQLR